MYGSAHKRKERETFFDTFCVLRFMRKIILFTHSLSPLPPSFFFPRAQKLRGFGYVYKKNERTTTTTTHTHTNTYLSKVERRVLFYSSPLGALFGSSKFFVVGVFVYCSLKYVYI